MTAGWTFFRSSGFPFLTVAMLCSAKCQQRALRFRSQVHECGCVGWDGRVRQWFVVWFGGSGERDNRVKLGNTYTMSPTPPAGSLFRRAPIPLTEMMYRFRAPELSAQFMMAPLQSCQLLHPCSGSSTNQVDFVGSRVGVCRAGKTYTGRPRVILSLPPGAPRLRGDLRQ